MKKLKLRLKLALMYAALFAVLLAVAGVAVYRIVALAQISAADDNLTDHCAGLWGYIEFPQGKPALVYDTENPAITYFVRDATRYFQLYEATTGELLLQSEDSALLRLALPPGEVGRVARHPGIDAGRTQGVPLRFRSLVFHANQHPYLLRVGVSVEEDLVNLAELRRVLWLLLPITTLVAVLSAWWMAGRSLRPLHDLENEARAISITQLHRRLPQRGTGDELDALATTFNQVFARLEDAVGRMKQFTATMSHELRTPLTVLQGEAEVALTNPEVSETCRMVLNSQLEEFRKLNRVASDLLVLARAEAGEMRFDKDGFDLSELALAVCDQMSTLAAVRNLSLRVECAAPITIYGDVAWLERVIVNLLDNAIKFTPSGGTVEVGTRVEEGSAVLEVSDTGIGIRPAVLPHIFDAFYQADSFDPKRTAGAGLGLALAKCVIEAHGGTIHATSQVGAGSRFRICLPRGEANREQGAECVSARPSAALP